MWKIWSSHFQMQKFYLHLLQMWLFTVWDVSQSKHPWSSNKRDNCDEEHAPSPKPTKCINCEGPVPAFPKQCPNYKQEQEIITLKYTLNISFPEAHKRICNKPISYASLSMKTTTSTATQTDKPSEHLISTKSNIPQSKLRLPQPATWPSKHTSTPSSSSIQPTKPTNASFRYLPPDLTVHLRQQNGMNFPPNRLNLLPFLPNVLKIKENKTSKQLLTPITGLVF